MGFQEYSVDSGFCIGIFRKTLQVGNAYGFISATDIGVIYRHMRKPIKSNHHFMPGLQGDPSPPKWLFGGMF